MAVTTRDNHASAELLEKLGFRFEKLVRLAHDEADLRLFAAVIAPLPGPTAHP